jgi:hypothetical protein
MDENVVMKHEDKRDPPHMIEARKKLLQEEMKTK